MSDRIKAFLESAGTAGKLGMEGQDTPYSSFMDDEDREATNEVIEPMSALMAIVAVAGNPVMIMRLGFIMGVAWARFKAEDQSPMNDLLKGVKGL